MQSLGLKRITQNIAGVFARDFLAAFSQLLMFLIIVRSVGAHGIGLYSVAMFLPAFFGQLFNLGLPLANIYFIASEKFELQEVWALGRNHTLVMSLFGLVLGYLLIFFGGDYFFPGVSDGYLFLGLLTFPANLFGFIVASFYKGLQDFKSVNLLTLVQPVSSLLMIAVLWMLGDLGIEEILWSTVCGYCIYAIACIWMVHRLPVSLLDRQSGLPYLKEAWRYGIKAQLCNVLAYLNFRIDVFLLNFLAGPVAVGGYSVATKIVEQLWMVSQAVSAVAFPHLASFKGDMVRRRALMPVLARFSLWVTALGSVVLIGLAPYFVPLLFGHDFDVSIPVVYALLPGIVLMSCAKVQENDFAAAGWVGVNLAISISVLLINITMNFVLIPDYGAFGAALATSISYGFDLVLRLAISTRVSGVRLWLLLLPQKDDFERVLQLLKK